ncbi:MAG: Sir2 family NAD-dependent protein deacetylase [Candidatus Rokubacteria bacterium]|nr:Sir2 family NAD-dependent protein deacetylase [Candidatus Rokubacteria bacterium]
MREVDLVADLVAGARRPVVFTGAGVSTESGIPDFRSPGGIWDRFDPDEFSYQNFVGSVEGRRKYWQLGRQIYTVVRNAQPNAAHYAIADLNRMGKLDCCITQNIDNLHQKAGLPPEKVIELHGNATRARCLGCDARYARDEIQGWLESGVEVPACPACGGIIKPNTILFGEAMPARETLEAEARAKRSDLFIVVGSSLVVYPAAMMPLYAKREGARLVIVNLSETPHDAYADVVIPGKAGPVMEQILERVKSRLG